MEELALNILDIAQNSVRADAHTIVLRVAVDTRQNRLSLTIADDGCGMSESFLQRVTDPFSTTRTTRKVGMGLPLFKMDALTADGSFDIKSKEGAGTEVKTTYRLDHIDRPPLGDVASTVIVLINGSPDRHWRLEYAVDGREFAFDTEEVKQILDGVPLDAPEVLKSVEELLRANIEESNGGIVL